MAVHNILYGVFPTGADPVKENGVNWPQFVPNFDIGVLYVK